MCCCSCWQFLHLASPLPSICSCRISWERYSTVQVRYDHLCHATIDLFETNAMMIEERNLNWSTISLRFCRMLHGTFFELLRVYLRAVSVSHSYERFYSASLESVSQNGYVILCYNLLSSKRLHSSMEIRPEIC
jgi:hypothetical protein